MKPNTTRVKGRTYQLPPSKVTHPIAKGGGGVKFENGIAIKAWGVQSAWMILEKAQRNPQ